MADPAQSPELIFARGLRGLDRRGLRAFAARLAAEVAAGRGFEALLTGDAELRRLNREFLGKDYATDVLSFPDTSAGCGLGSLAISAPRAAEQARAFGHTTDDEVRVLLLHGVLHLLGHDHDRDRGQMARLERRWRRRLGLPAGLIERAKRP